MKKMSLKSVVVFCLMMVMFTSAIFADVQWDEFTYNDPNITYVGTGWYGGSNPHSPDGGIYVTLKSGDEYKFNFTGTSIKIFSPGPEASSYDLSSTLILDGTIEIKPILERGKFSAAYDISGLENREHSVRVINGSTGVGNAISPTRIHLLKGEKLLPYNEKTATPQKILTFETENNTKRVHEIFKLDMYMQNIKEIAAEDLLIQYDPAYLAFEGFKEKEGIKIVYSNAQKGEIRVVMASLGEKNVINTKTMLANMNFRALKKGETTVSYQKAKVTDGLTYEKPLKAEELGDILLYIKEPQFLDVNKSGKYTLLDLGILARHFNALLPNDLYILDQFEDGKVDDLDLIEVYKRILENPEYTFESEAN